MSTLGERVSARMKELDLSQEQVAERLRAITPDGKGSQGLISQIINGTNSGSKYIVQLATVLKTSANELLYGQSAHAKLSKDAAHEIDLENNEAFPAVKKVKIRVSAGITGFGVEPVTGDDSLIVFRSDWYQSRKLKPENLLALKVYGTSMEPNLYDGDVVVMNRADTELTDGDVFVFNLDGEVVIKRAVRDQGQWWLDSDNQDKTRFTRKACPEGICITIGRVIHRQTERI